MSFVKVLGEGLMLRVSEEDKQELLVVRSQAASGPRKQGLRDAALRGRSVCCGVAVQRRQTGGLCQS